MSRRRLRETDWREPAPSPPEAQPRTSAEQLKRWKSEAALWKGDDYLWLNRFVAVVAELRELQEALRDVTAYSVLQHSGKYAVDADVMERLFALAASSEEPG